ncbi:MAG: antitermination protein NusG [Ruminococcus sp.]|nr:antitermination protein NusG [Ruminococcus sp.]MDE6849237.1 antitermination protein NusG [Ruminococcus sp.]MDE7137275.1 antitermination protein NusG [Ruminococcus sp.]
MEIYVLQVKFNKEIKVRDAVGEMGFSVFFPTEEIIVRNKGKVKPRIRPIFPQYVFVECEMTVENYRLIKSVREVVRFLGAENPEPLPPDEKEYIMLLNNGGETVRASEIEVSADGTKKIVSGVLKKYADKITFIDLRQNRAGIGLELCGKKHSVILPVTKSENSV